MESLIQFLPRKSMLIRDNGRSADYMAPAFGYGCLYNCNYCTLKRHKPTGVLVATNTFDILTAINNHSMFATVDKPNQTHDKYVTYDIAYNDDLSLHAKYYDWEAIFTFFKNHDKAMATFATKYVNPKLLSFNPEGKVRIRFSLMPQKYSTILEPNTSTIIDRIKAIDMFKKAGYDVHINFSPVIVTDNWLDEYRILFKNIDKLVTDKDNVHSEVIFLTHNKNKHDYNITNNIAGEDLLWNPEIQEDKVSQCGGLNLRYKVRYKTKWINQFKELHNELISWNNIRYIF